LLHVTLFFELEYAIPNKNTVNKAVVKGFGWFLFPHTKRD
jgi:hypothetical protein